MGNMVGALHGPFYPQQYIDTMQESYKKDFSDNLDAFVDTLSRLTCTSD
jgi:hypothetical protein